MRVAFFSSIKVREVKITKKTFPPTTTEMPPCRVTYSYIHHNPVLMNSAPQGDVFTYIHHNPGLSEELAVRLILEPFLNGVQVLHAQGLIHRDIKPENILMNKALHIKIADFGLSIDSKCERANTRCVHVCLVSHSVTIPAIPCSLLLPSPAACYFPPLLPATALPCCLLLPSPAA